MAIKIIHCADIHFDTPFAGMDTALKARLRKEDLREVFGRIIALVKKEQADMLLIGGDLFDQDGVSNLTIRYLQEKFSEIAPTSVFISAGNHDPKTAKSYYNILNWGENVHIFDTTMQKISLPECDIYGISFAQSYAEQSLLSAFTVQNTDKINLMLMHADLSGGAYNPITKEEIKTSGLDYLALGHVHKYSGMQQFGNTVCAYPGCPEGRGFDELGEKGVIVAEVEKNNVQLRFEPVCKRIYHEVTVDVTDIVHHEGICAAIVRQINGSRDDLYKIILTGETDLDIDHQLLLEQLDYFMVKIVDQTTSVIDYTKLANENNLKGLFVKNLLEQMEKTEDKIILKKALDYGLCTFFGEKVKTD